MDRVRSTCRVRKNIPTKRRHSLATQWRVEPTGCSVEHDESPVRFCPPLQSSVVRQPQSDIRERPFHYLGGGAGRVVFSRLFFHLMFKAGFFFQTPVEARFFFHKELKVRLFFYSHVSSQRYSHYFQGWGKIIFFATYQSKKFFSTYRLGQTIFFGQKQRQIIFSKTLPAPPPPPDNEMVPP